MNVPGGRWFANQQAGRASGQVPDRRARGVGVVAVYSGWAAIARVRLEAVSGFREDRSGEAAATAAARRLPV
jgi:hypothetical protein